MAKRNHGDGHIERRDDGAFRLRYRINGKRQSKTLPRGTTKAEAGKELRKVLGSVETGEHVDPTRITVGQWIDQWIAAGAPGRKKKKVMLSRSSARVPCRNSRQSRSTHYIASWSRGWPR
jgi:hypothetical protein